MSGFTAVASPTPYSGEDAVMQEWMPCMQDVRSLMQDWTPCLQDVRFLMQEGTPRITVNPFYLQEGMPVIRASTSCGENRETQALS